MTHLTTTVPEGLKKTVLPFLQRADELEASNQALPAYFVRTYAAQQVLRNRDAQDPVQKAYLLDILGYLEKYQQENKAELANVDGRTVLTKLAFTLFDRADELERQSQCSPQICKMFFTASFLFETTKQFNDNKMDPIAAEKHKYARYIAGRMSKSLREGTAYESVHKSAQDQLGGAEGASAAAAAAEKTLANPNGEVASVAAGGGSGLNLPPAPSHQPSSNNNTAASTEDLTSQLPNLPPVPGAPSTYNTFSKPLPPPPSALHPNNNNNNSNQEQQYQQPPTSTTPPQQQMQMPPPPPPQQQQQPQQPPQYNQQPPPPPPPPQQQQQYQPAAPVPAPAPAPPKAPTTTTTSAPAYAPEEASEDDLDKVMNSQKWAKQAIAALQFADIQTAKTMLKRALDCLGQ